MSRNKIVKIRRIEVDKMAVMAKDKPNVFMIKPSKAKEFISEVNSNIATEEFWNECREASKFFKKRRFR